MNQASTHFLRGVIFLLALGALALCVLVLPRGIIAEMSGDFDYGYIFIGMYLSAMPFFFALYQTLKLLKYIDTNKAFSNLSVKALKNIKFSALSISGLYAAGMPYIFYLAEKDDAPGVAAIGLVIIGASFVIAVFAAVLEKLLNEVITIKSENELTV